MRAESRERRAPGGGGSPFLPQHSGCSRQAPTMEVRFVNTSVPPGRVTARKTFPLADLAFEITHLGPYLRSICWHLSFPILQMLTGVSLLEWWEAGWGSGNTSSNPRMCRVQPCFGEVAGGWVTASQSLSGALTERKGRSLCADPLPW